MKRLAIAVMVMLGLVRSFAAPSVFDPRATDLYVDRNAAVGGDGSVGTPFQTIHDAIAVSTTGVSIHIASGLYIEPINMTLAVSGVRLIGSTVLTRDASGLATGGTTTGTATTVCPAQPVPAAQAMFQVTAANVGVSGLVLDGTCPQGPPSPGSEIVVDGSVGGADGFVISNNEILHSAGAPDLVVRLAAGAITGNYIAGSGTGAQVFGWPEVWTGSRQLQFLANRVTQNSLVGAIFNGSVGALRAPAFPALDGVLTVEIAGNDFRLNGTDPSIYPGNSPNTGLYFMLNDSVASDPTFRGQVQASVHDNQFVENSWYGMAVGQRLDPNKRVTGYDFSGEFDRNLYCGNGLQDAFIDLRHIPTSQGGGTQHFRYARNSTIAITTSSDSLASAAFDLDHPEFDPDAHDYINPTEHENAGAPLSNVVLLNGAPLANATRITHGPTVVTSCTAIAPGPADAWIGLKNSDDVGTYFDLLAEVLKNGTVVGSGMLTGVSGGSSGFNNAVLRSIPVTMQAPQSMLKGDTLMLRLSVRIAQDVSGHRSGTARLWYNDATANSLLDAIVNGVHVPYYLQTGGVLATVPGGARSFVDMTVDKAVGGNLFKSFGPQWSITF